MKKLIKFLFLGIVKIIAILIFTLVLNLFLVIPAIAAWYWSWFILLWYIIPVIFVSNKFNGIVYIISGWWQYYRMKQKIKLFKSFKL